MANLYVNPAQNYKATSQDVSSNCSCHSGRDWLRNGMVG